MFLLVGAVVLLAACSEGPPLPLATAPVSPTVTAGPAPDARSVAPESLLDPGARPQRVLYGRLLPGAGEQIVLESSRDIGCDDRQDYLQVFSSDGAKGRWDAVFDADLWPSASRPLIPDREDVSEPCRGSEELRALALMDMDGDGLLELVIGLGTAADGKEGPLVLEVLSFAPGVAEPLYEQATTRGGAVSVQPGRLVLEQPTFPSRSGPLWRGEDVPNGRLREVIAWDRELRQPVVVERNSTLSCAQGVVEDVSPDAVFVRCPFGSGSGAAPGLTGFRVTEETRVSPREVGGVDGLEPGREVSVRSAGAEPDEEDRVNPVALEIVVITEQRQASAPVAGF